jgi:hypothetical protein
MPRNDEYEAAPNEPSAETKCDKCKDAPAEPLHSCPYQADVHNNDEFQCDCCASCTHECAMDV